MVKLEGHKTWALVRHHVLGQLSLEEMSKGLPSEWREFLASWEVDGSKVHMPVIDDPYVFLGARLNSGYEMHISEKCWKPFIDKWNREVATPNYGQPIYTRNLGVAIITNIHLFRLALKYIGKRAS